MWPASISSARRGILFIVSAPSGAGKTTLINKLLKIFPDIALSVSCTTRPRRTGERAGRDYHFVSAKRFAAVRARKGFAEWASVHGALYGTPRTPLEGALRRGRDMLLDIDVQGARKIKRLYSDAVSIFVMPPSWRVLEQRLAGRGTDGRKTILRRLENARREIREIVRYDYVVVNSDLAGAVAAAKAIVLAERHRVSRRLRR
jgi:guanylate kinase